VAIAVVATGALFYALVALAAQCGEVCVSDPRDDEGWEQVRGAWQWTAQFVLAFLAYAVTLVSVAQGASGRPSVRALMAAVVLWGSWWVLFEKGLDGIL